MIRYYLELVVIVTSPRRRKEQGGVARAARRREEKKASAASAATSAASAVGTQHARTARECRDVWQRAPREAWWYTGAQRQAGASAVALQMRRRRADLRLSGRAPPGGDAAGIN